MLIQITKRADGASLLRCVRDDGSITWQKLPRHSAHFSLHDLTHFAVETTLGLQRAFFGLIKEGWDIEDTTGKGTPGPIPPDAAVAEQLVGYLDAERATGVIWTIEQFREFSGEWMQSITAEDLAAIRRRRSELFEQWAQVEVNGVLELSL